ncbi:hypothetical protein Aduo_009960 [Ancylostoma duodenale]
MVHIVAAFLYFVWSSCMNPGVALASADIDQEHGDSENGLNGDVGIPPVIAKTESGEKIIEGNIIVSNGERRKRQAAIEREQYGKWSEGVKYVFSPNASDELKDCFRKAAAAWERDTCINFKEGRARDYLYVADAGGYYSHVGKFGGRQNFSLESNCGYMIGHAIHQLGHALGLYHTHSRYDRDSYVTVRPDKIKEYPNEYRIITQQEANTYGTEYDYGSIMHFGSNVHNPIFFLADENYRRTMGSHMLSFTDLWLINKHYGCFGI